MTSNNGVILAVKDTLLLREWILVIFRFLLCCCWSGPTARSCRSATEVLCTAIQYRSRRSSRLATAMLAGDPHH